MKMTTILDSVNTDRMQFGDAYMPTLAIKYSLAPQPGEHDNIAVRPGSPKITIGNGTGGGSKLRVTITLTNKNTAGSTASTTTYIFDGAAGGAGTVTAVCATLKDLIDQINLIPGMTAFAAHAPHALSLASNDFVSAAEAGIRTDNRFGLVLYRDVSEAITDTKGTASQIACYMRVGNPELRDSGWLRLLGIAGKCTGATSNPVVRLLRDEYGKDPEFLYEGTLITAVQTAYVTNTMDNAESYRAPLLLEVASSDLSAADFTVKTMQGQV